jgi:hypothetical protein
LASAALLFLSLWLLILSPVPMLLDLLRKRLSLRDTISPIPSRKILFSVIRGHLSASYFISFHLVRYYMILLLPLGFAFPPLWLFSLCLLIPVSLIDFKAKRPELTFPTFLFYSILEHLSYQIGVLIGCIRRRFFGCYLPMIPSRAWGKEEGT